MSQVPCSAAGRVPGIAESWCKRAEFLCMTPPQVSTKPLQVWAIRRDNVQQIRSSFPSLIALLWYAGPHKSVPDWIACTAWAAGIVLSVILDARSRRDFGVQPLRIEEGSKIALIGEVDGFSRFEASNWTERDDAFVVQGRGATWTFNPHQADRAALRSILQQVTGRPAVVGRTSTAARYSAAALLLCVFAIPVLLTLGPRLASTEGWVIFGIIMASIATMIFAAFALRIWQ